MDPLGRSTPCCTPPTQCSHHGTSVPSVIALADPILIMVPPYPDQVSSLLHLIKFGLKRDLKNAHLFSHLVLLTQEPS